MSKRVFIGVGHGGSDPGAVSYVHEAKANLTIALELKKALEAAGLTVGISRTRDEDDPLSEEIRKANAFKPDLAVEVHNNAGGGNGWECLVQTNSYSAQSRACALAIEAEVKAIGQQSRSLKTRLNSAGADYFGWLRQVKAPAVLLEGFFVDNKADAADFDTVAEQQALGRAYARGVLKYLGVTENTEEEKPAPAENWSPSVGDVVQFTGGTHYTSANAAKGDRCGKGEAVITSIYRTGKHPYHLKRTGKTGPYGWVNAGTFTRTGAKASTKKSNEEIALEVYRGKWGNGVERKNRLEAAGYDYDVIQTLVTKMH